MRDVVRWLTPTAFGLGSVLGGSFLPDGHAVAGVILFAAGVTAALYGLARLTNASVQPR